MANQNWLVAENGEWRAIAADERGERPHEYRLYRFITEIEDILAASPQAEERLTQICPLVRQLLNDSAWLQFAVEPPNPKTGWSVNTLYDEPGFPLTIQTVVWQPGQVSKIHNHGTWGIVALLSGSEKNVLWRRPNTEPTGPENRLMEVGEVLLQPGDLIGFMPDAIHCIEALAGEPTVSFNVYGATDFENRWKFDRQSHEAELF